MADEFAMLSSRSLDVRQEPICSSPHETGHRVSAAPAFPTYDETCRLDVFRAGRRRQRRALPHATQGAEGAHLRFRRLREGARARIAREVGAADRRGAFAIVPRATV